MIKCKCNNCHTEDVYVDEKAAWMDGWDLLSDGTMFCEKCPASHHMIDKFKTTVLDIKPE